MLASRDALLLRTGKLKNVFQTGTLMARLSIRYCHDVAPFMHMSFPEFFEHVKMIPYNRDPKGMEFLQRPYFTLKAESPGGDCDDRAICVGAFAYNLGMPFRFLAMARVGGTPLHHVATDVMLNGQWKHIDPTYNTQVMGKYLFRPARCVVIGAWNGYLSSAAA